ncbi:hypothetical protein FisN_19Hh015 [Fistulifera solaris]|uniref:Protein kinase domain-containing protein n=1 Tax=Fistulifera solaris TaxID=1519565 RepID=A0A1Z5JZI2_FISSO|nr:hypothetical protein FisN_19Hh015 [Fistulifera solaris]|eukprot:GAX19443.1 hypothetical protein FisN_19Hh015 [Fistulifera solaris]
MRRLLQWESGSSLVKQQHTESTNQIIPHLKTNDIVVGEQLAQGCFGAVYAVTFTRGVWNANAQQLVVKRARCFLQTQANAKLEVDDLDDEERQKQQKKQNISFFDLACEAQFLQHLPPHPHIIHLRAILGNPGTFEYGLVFDKLALTLAELVDDKWRTEYASCIGGRRLRWWNNTARTRAFYYQRVETVKQLASALNHLHRYSIVYRDMKPPNIGFAINKDGSKSNDYGHLQLFDFGCAKELKVKHLIEQPDGYRATPMTGTVGYMAPEVMLHQPYGLSADVFSFAMMMWYIFSLQKPIDHNQMCSSTAVDDMLYRHKRPRALPVLSDALQQLMQQCWVRDRLQRPKFPYVLGVLEAELASQQPQTAAPGQ